LTVNFAAREVRLRDEPLALSPTEHRLLLMLVRHAGTTLTNRRLIESAWADDQTRDDRSLKTFMNRLRHKLGDNAAYPHYIRTVRGVGYHFLRPDTAVDNQHG